MRRLDGLRADAGIVRTLLRGMPRTGTARQRLDAFYAPQAQHYDRFRERLLRGREALIAGIDVPDRARIVELGGGTGRNIEFFGAGIERIADYHVVDLCQPLLDQAQARARRWPQLRCVHADAAHWRPQRPADVVLLSYALSMMPPWRSVLANARAMLAPGGTLAVVDFHVSEAMPPAGRTRHGWIERRFWPAWFGHDGVRLDTGALSALCELLPEHRLVEERAAVPWLPLLRVPTFRFLGRVP